MSGDPAHDHGSPGPASSHLDEDPEALEDPVHRGDATHQHAAHLRDAAARAGAATASDDDGDTGDSGTAPGGARDGTAAADS